MENEESVKKKKELRVKRKKLHQKNREDWKRLMGRYCPLVVRLGNT